MMRHLAEHDVTVTWDELPDKEHWWWDSEKSSDGGCVNDQVMRYLRVCGWVCLYGCGCGGVGVEIDR
jgi:hypothetical protein